MRARTSWIGVMRDIGAARCGFCPNGCSIRPTGQRPHTDWSRRPPRPGFRRWSWRGSSRVGRRGSTRGVIAWHILGPIPNERCPRDKRSRTCDGHEAEAVPTPGLLEIIGNRRNHDSEDYGCNDVACGVLRPEQKSALWARHSIRVPELRGRKEAKDKTAGWTRWVLHGEGVTPPRHGSPTAAGSGRWLRIQHPKKPERPNSRRGATVRSGVC
jgi:hypothetical protein